MVDGERPGRSIAGSQAPVAPHAPEGALVTWTRRHIEPETLHVPTVLLVLLVTVSAATGALSLVAGHFLAELLSFAFPVDSSTLTWTLAVGTALAAAHAIRCLARPLLRG